MRISGAPASWESGANIRLHRFHRRNRKSISLRYSHNLRVEGRPRHVVAPDDPMIRSRKGEGLRDAGKVTAVDELLHL